MTTPIIRRTIVHLSAWRGSDFKSKDAFAEDISNKQIAAFVDAVRKAKKAGLTLDTVSRATFDLSPIAADVERWHATIMDGRQFIMLRGFPMKEYPLEDISMMYYGLGVQFGTAVSQSVLGDRLGEVMDYSDIDPNERAYRNKMFLTLHTDINDILGMLGVRKARTGGASQYASVITIHNEILARRPDLLEPLYEGYHYHLRGEEAPGDLPYTPHKVPVFSTKDGVLSCRWVDGYMQAAAKYLGVEMSPKLVEALEFFDDVAREVQVEFIHEPGEIIFANNLTMLHGRAAFENSGNPAEKRLLLRLWLDVDGPRKRPRVPEVAIWQGDTIGKQAGKRPTYDGEEWDRERYARSDVKRTGKKELVS